MDTQDVCAIINTVVGIIGIIVGIIGGKALSAANKNRSKIKNANNSTIQQAQIINNGLDSYAVIKLSQETTQEELANIIERINNAERKLDETVNNIENSPKIFTRKDSPENPKEGDIWIQ